MLLSSHHQPCQTHQHPFHTTAQSPALSFTNAPFPRLPSYQPCQTHQHPFHTTALSLALSELPTPLLQNHQLLLWCAQSPVLSDSPKLISCYCPVTSPVRLANNPFILLSSNHQHPFSESLTPLSYYITTAQLPALSESPKPLLYYCPVTSPVRITSTPFILLPSH